MENSNVVVLIVLLLLLLVSALEMDPRIITTSAIILAVILFKLTLGWVISVKLSHLTGRQNITNLLTVILAIAAGLYILNIWNLLPAITATLATLGIVGSLIVLIIKDIWLTNFFAGISLIGNPLVNIGNEVEIGTVKGKITEISLTVTKLQRDDGGIVLIPNKVFNEQVISVKTNRDLHQTI